MNQSSSYLPMVIFSSVLKSSILYNRKEGQIDEIELIETFQRSQMNNIIEEVTPTILSQDSLDPCLAHFRWTILMSIGIS